MKSPFLVLLYGSPDIVKSAHSGKLLFFMQLRNGAEKQGGLKCALEQIKVRLIPVLPVFLRKHIWEYLFVLLFLLRKWGRLDKVKAGCHQRSRLMEQTNFEQLCQKYADVMEDRAVTNISGWTEPNSDTPCDEIAYRERLKRNAPVLHKKISEALSFD